MEGCRDAFKILTGKRTRRSRHTWEDGVRIDLKEIGANTRN